MVAELAAAGMVALVAEETGKAVGSVEVAVAEGVGMVEQVEDWGSGIVQGLD